MRIRARFAFRVVLALVLVVTQALTAPARAASHNGDVERAALSRAFDFIDTLASSLPRTGFDPTALVETLDDTSPQALLSLVRERTRMVPYRGMLRGSRGVLIDGTGNSADRALLLGELLRASGHDIRLVRGTLTRDVAATLHGALSEAVVALRAPEIFAAHRQAMGVAIESAAASSGEDFSPLATAMTQALDGFERDGAAARAAAAAQSRALIDAIAFGEGDTAAEVAAQIDVLREHWWVQVRQNDGAWYDLDPSASGATALAHVEESIDVDESRPIELSVSQDRFHRLSVRVVLEQWSGGSAIEHVALETTLIPALTIEAPIAIQFIPANSPGATGIAETDDPAGMIAAQIATSSEWSTRLTVGAQASMGRAFNDRGYFVEDATEGGGGMFDGLFGSVTSSLEQAEGGTLSAVWIDYDMVSPNGAVETTRRMVFDLVGVAVRATGGAAEPQVGEQDAKARAFALSDRITILPQVGWLAPSFVAYLETNDVAAQRLNLELLLSGEPVVTGDREPSGFVNLAPYVLALARGAWGGVDQGLFLSRVNVLTSHERLVGDGTGERSFDIVGNAVDAIARPGKNLHELRLAQGVADTIAEALILGRGDPGANTAIAFSRSRAANVPWRVVRSDDDIVSTPIDDETLARVGAAIGAGNIAVVPTRLIDEGSGAAWWQINPATGTALGIGRHGWGADTSEYTIMLPPLRSGAVSEGYFGYITVLSLIFACADIPILSLATPLWEKSYEAASGIMGGDGKLCPEKDPRRASIDLDQVPDIDGR